MYEAKSGFLQVSTTKLITTEPQGAQRNSQSKIMVLLCVLCDSVVKGFSAFDSTFMVNLTPVRVAHSRRKDAKKCIDCRFNLGVFAA